MNFNKVFHRSIFLLFLISFIYQLSCTTEEMSEFTTDYLIPVPQLLVATGEYFDIDSRTSIFVAEGNEELAQIGALLSGDMEKISGLKIENVTGKKVRRSNVIVLSIDKDSQIGEEGYTLDIGKRRILITASEFSGIYYGTQTLKQLFFFDAKHSDEKGISWKIATGIVNDHPEFSYRGTMLDVSRHFFTVKDVKSYIDYIALYKMNVLHLHLSDDQGWRIEIKSWPKLTEIGGSTEVGGGEGGFYTQEEYSEIVKYAAERYITIIPEIDMPGHTNAALASYPELNCSGKSPELYTGTRVGFSTFCTSSEITYQFIDDVVRELAALTPGPYIHIGGDESHVTAKEDYIPFINRVQDIVISHGKRVVGWDEITHADMKSESVAQYWASSENALKAVAHGAKIIMSPAKRCYLDMQYNESSPLGLNWSGYIELDSAYSWDPLTLVEGITKDDILGIESPLWAETIQTIDDIEYLAFPRIIGHSEIGWSPVELRDWESYKIRLGRHGKLMDFLEIDYYKSPLVDWE